MRESLRPQKSNDVQKAMLTVNLKLEVPIDQSDPDAANRVIEKMLTQFGIEPDRFRLEWISASEGDRFVTVMDDMVRKVKELGPLCLETQALL